MTQQQMVAMVRTLLYFMGKQNYMPTAAAVTPILLEALGAQALVAPTSGWDVSSNKALPSAPPNATWNVSANKAR